MTNNSSNNYKRLYRSRTNRTIAGICAGFSEYFAVDVTLVRVIWLVSVFFGGLGLIAYIVALVIMPENPEQTGQPEPKKESSKNMGLIIGISFIVFGLMFLSRGFHFPFFNWDVFNMVPFHGRAFWPLLIILGGVIYIVHVLHQNKKPVDLESDENVKEPQTTVKKFFRSRNDRMIAGICGGLAKFWNIDPVIIRLGYALLTIVSGFFPGIIIYIICMIVVPEDQG